MNPVIFGDTPIIKTTIKKKEAEVSSGLNFDFFSSESAVSVPYSDVDTGEIKKKRGPGRPAKKSVNGKEVILAEDEKELAIYQTNQPYAETYTETTNMLRNSIVQVDILSSEVKEETDKIRSSKTLKGKYQYLSLLTSTMSTLIGTKVAAIREINKTIGDCHNLEIKRVKDLKMTEANAQDDDKHIMDMYSAFVSAPVGSYSPQTLSSIDMSTMGGSQNIVRADMQSNSNDGGYSNYINNMTPAQNMMRLENDPNAKTVICYDQETGNRYFEVMDMSTRQVIPNVDKPDSLFLEDTVIDIKNNIARNTNLDMSYPLVFVGNGTLDQY